MPLGQGVWVNFDGMRTVFKDQLDLAACWLTDVRDLGGLSEAQMTKLAVDDIPRDLARMKETSRLADTALLNVALLGAFSSGKSFLLSALQGHAQAIEGEDAMGTIEYITLLPNGPDPTTLVPTRVVPGSHDEGRDAANRLLVRFEDSSRWQDVGVIESDEIIAAYATSRPEFVHLRQADHVGRPVEEAKVTLGSWKLPVVFSDLPGYSAPNETPSEVIRACIEEADCFVYVTRAHRTLSDQDLDLIEVVFDHHGEPYRPVIWVITGIDESGARRAGMPENWKRVRDEDNQLLRESFAKSGSQIGDRFYGQGFIPVAPTLEARANMLEPDNPELAEQLRDRSGMDKLRGHLIDLIESRTGPRFLSTAAEQTIDMINARLSVLRTLQETIGRSNAELNAKLSAARFLITATDADLLERSNAIKADFADRIRDMAGRSDARGLANHLRSVLTTQIEESDILKPRILSSLKVAHQQAISNWIALPHGLGESWKTLQDQLDTDVRRACQGIQALALSDKNVDLPEAVTDIDINALLSRDALTDSAESTPLREALLRILKLTAKLTPVAAGGTTTLVAIATKVGVAVGVSAGAVTFMTPAGIALIVACGSYSGWKLITKKSELAKARRKLINELDDHARNAVDAFVAQANVQGQALIDCINKYGRGIHNELIAQQDVYLVALNQPELRLSRNIIDKLASLSARARDIVRSLGDIRMGRVSQGPIT
jgi:hypothetical protein